MREEGLLSAAKSEDDLAFESNIRPQTLADFVGQEEMKERLSILVEAAREREEPVDHILFSGPPGLGKTTLAMILANEVGTPQQLRSTSGPAIVRPGDLVAILSNLQAGDVLFIDEIHRISRQVEEILYTAMEDGFVDIVTGKGASAHSIRFTLEPFTLVGATTRVGRVSPPLRDRFGYIARIDYYPETELHDVVVRTAGLLGIDVSESGARTIADRSRGTPRVANRLLRRVRDYAAVRSDATEVGEAVALQALRVFEVDDVGLDRVDRAILEAIVHKFGGGPVGLLTLAIAVSEEQQTVEDAYEPFLIQTGFLQRTPRGRIATSLAYRHLGLEVPDQVEQAKLL